MARRRGTPSSGSRQVLSVGFTVLVLVVLASLYIVREAFGVDLGPLDEFLPTLAPGGESGGEVPGGTGVGVSGRFVLDSPVCDVAAWQHGTERLRACLRNVGEVNVKPLELFELCQRGNASIRYFRIG